MAFNLLVLASNLKAMASNLLAMASNLEAILYGSYNIYTVYNCIDIYIYTHIYVYIYIYVFWYVLMETSRYGLATMKLMFNTKRIIFSIHTIVSVTSWFGGLETEARNPRRDWGK